MRLFAVLNNLMFSNFISYGKMFFKKNVNLELFKKKLYN